KKSGMVNITSSVNSRERSGINTILHELNPLFTINVTMRDIKSKNVYSRVNSKATTQWRKTESANGVHLEGVASRSEERFSRNAETDLVCRLLLEKKKSLLVQMLPTLVWLTAELRIKKSILNCNWTI